MTGLERYRGRKVGVLGLARTGLAATRALLASGAKVAAFDDRPEAVAAAQALGASAGRPDAVSGLAALVVSPGVPLHLPAPHPLIAAARAAGVPITGDIDLFAMANPDLVLVGVTGTNGKSTTTALIHHLLVTAGCPALQGGNIGRPVLELPTAEPGTVAVLELSSYQLDLCTELRCRVAVWLNLAPDHLDRHGDLAGYIAAKRRIFAGQRPGDAAVIGIDDEPSAALADELTAAGRRVVPVTVGQTVEAGVGVVDGVLFDGLEATPHPVADLRGARGLRGRHNHQNAAAAFAAVRCLGPTAMQAAAGFANFTGLPHRMEEVGQVERVRFINDSKATNPASAATSLAAFDNIFWIAGGQAKPGGFAALHGSLGRVRAAFLIGAAADELALALAGRVPVRQCGTLAMAIEMANDEAVRSELPNPVVLLAPACASFDQFTSYEARGDTFRRLVRELGGTRLLFPEALR